MKRKVEENTYKSINIFTVYKDNRYNKNRSAAPSGDDACQSKNIFTLRPQPASALLLMLLLR